jgi:hypothetical protein
VYLVTEASAGQVYYVADNVVVRKCSIAALATIFFGHYEEEELEKKQ